MKSSYINHKYLPLTLLLLHGIFGCGSGSNSDEGQDPVVSMEDSLEESNEIFTEGNDEQLLTDFSPITGDWSGVLTQQSEVCSDGSSSFSRVESETIQADFMIIGADDFGQSGTLRFQNCLYNGIRGTIFEIEFQTSDDGCPEAVEFLNIGGDTLTAVTRPAPPEVDPGASLTCSRTFVGEVVRQ